MLNAERYPIVDLTMTDGEAQQVSGGSIPLWVAAGLAPHVARAAYDITNENYVHILKGVRDIVRRGRRNGGR